MNETMTRDERRSRLDAFAEAAAPGDNALVPIAGYQPPAQQVHGAQQLAQYRDKRKVLQEIKAEAAAAGDDWYYSFPVRNKRTGRTDRIEGLGIKGANAVARIYGNCEIDCRATDLGSAILFHARFIDLETGFSETRPFQQRKSAAKIGGADDERREDMAFQIGASKAIRNVIINALQTMADFALAEAKEAIYERIAQDPKRWLRTTVERITGLVSLDRVEAVVGRKAEDWSPGEIARVIAMGKAVSEKMATVDELFPKLEDEKAEGSPERLDRFASGVVEDGTVEASPPAPSTASPAAPPPSTEDGLTGPIVEGAAGDHEDAEVSLDPDQIAEIIDKTLGLASEGATPVPDRLDNLESQLATLQDSYPEVAKWCETVVSMAVKVAKGELAKAAAKRYLIALSPGAAR